MKKIIFKNIGFKLFTVVSFLQYVVIKTLAVSPTACPSGTNNSTTCISGNLGLQNIDLNRFFPTLGLNDIVGTGSTLLLAGMLVFFGIKIIIAGYRFVNNDNQDKSKKDAIKSLINGIIGVVLAFSAYFIVLLVRSITTGDDQLVNCAGLYYRDYSAYEKNSLLVGSSINDLEEEFRRCIRTAGYEGLLNLNKTSGGTLNYFSFTKGLRTSCEYNVPSGVNILALDANNISDKTKYVAIDLTAKKIKIIDQVKLNQCFVNEVRKLN